MASKERGRQYTLEDRGDLLLISIPTPKIWFYLLPWGGALVISLCMVATGESGCILGFGLGCLLLILWHFFRKEIVEVNDSSITLAHDILGVRLLPRHYLADDIRELRESVATIKGLVAFDYGSATVAFGQGLDAAGARNIVGEITRRYPRYHRDHSRVRAQQERSFYGAPIPFRGLSRGIEAPPPRHRSEISGNTLIITIPSKKMWSRITFLAIWLAIWSFFPSILLQATARGEGGVFVNLLLSFWAISEILGVYHMLWQLLGKEQIEVNPDSIVIRRVILGIGLSKVYAREQISRMRIDATGRVEPYSLGSEGVSLSRGTGLIAFDYREKTIRLGIGVEEAEAKALVTEIQRQFPQYMK